MAMLTAGRYAAVTSTLALVVALGGTSYAALQITGKNIKNNTVSSKDVKDKTLKTRDLSPAARSELTGATGPAGATGPSNVFTVFNNAATAGSGTFKPVLSLALDPGSYTAFGKSWAHRTATGSTQYQNCQLQLGATVVDASGGDLPDVSAAYNTVAVNASFTIAAPTTLTLSCYVTTSATTDFKRLTAIKVGTVSNVAGPNVARPARAADTRPDLRGDG